MKVLHTIPTIDPASGGTVEGLRQLCHIYRIGGHEIEVASLDSPESIDAYNFPAKVFALGPGRGVYGYSRRAIPWLKANIHRYDVVLINGIWSYNTVATYRALAGTNIPFAIFTHGMLDPYFKKQFPFKHLKKSIYWHTTLRRIMHDANAVLFTCEEEKILARQSFPRYRVHEVVVPFGIFGPNCDLEAAAEEFFDRWPNLRGKRLAISLGRVHPKKGTDILIEAFASTLAENPAWHLVIAGPDQIGWQKELEALAIKLGIADRITWTGMLQGTLKWGAFAASEVFVLPSHQENFGIVVAEALSCSLPVIVSDKVNIWRETMSYWAGLVSEDTLDGINYSLRRWSSLTCEEITDLRARGKKCFDERFNYALGAAKMLEKVDWAAWVDPKSAPSSPAA